MCNGLNVNNFFPQP